jgi:tripartite-type tricarboxylate transporter receptor subunit TctC
MINRAGLIVWWAFGAAVSALDIRPAAAAEDAKATALNYPTRPVRLIVPFPPGGGADFMGRFVAQGLNEKHGYTVVVDNRGGAGGAIGGALAAKAIADGHTLVLANNTTHVMVVAINRKPPYDPVRDFTPVSMVTYAPQLLVASTTVAPRTVGDLIALAKAKPGILNYASGGNASQTHLAAELFRVTAAIDVRHVPYKGTGPGFTALMSGEAQFMFVSMPAAMPHVQGGRVHGLAITGAKRSSLLPGMPTLAESGIRGFEINPWFGVLGPAGLPVSVVRKLNADLVSAVRNDDMKQRLVSQGAEAIGSSPDEFAAVIKQELKQWTRITEQIGLRH